MAFFVLRKLFLQSRMRSHPMGLDVWFLVGHFVYFQTSCVRTAKALASLRGCAGSPEPSLVAYVISTIISWAGSFHFVSTKQDTWTGHHHVMITSFLSKCVTQRLLCFCQPALARLWQLSCRGFNQCVYVQIKNCACFHLYIYSVSCIMKLYFL